MRIPTGVMSQLLVDDGVADRGHRQSLLNPAWRFVGIACGGHSVYGGMCVLDFAVGFEESAQPGFNQRAGKCFSSIFRRTTAP